MNPRDREAGNAAVELAPVALVLIMFLALAVTAGRIIIARNAIADAAREAARQASIARTPAQAQADALSSAQSVLAADHLDCTPQVTVRHGRVRHPARRTGPGHRPGDLRRTAVRPDPDPRHPRQRPLSATFTSPLDIYRAR